MPERCRSPCSRTTSDPVWACVGSAANIGEAQHTGCSGALAQLVARFHGMEEVRSSNLLCSTRSRGPSALCSGLVACLPTVIRGGACVPSPGAGEDGAGLRHDRARRSHDVSRTTRGSLVRCARAKGDSSDGLRLRCLHRRPDPAGQRDAGGAPAQPLLGRRTSPRHVPQPLLHPELATVRAQPGGEDRDVLFQGSYKDAMAGTSRRRGWTGPRSSSTWCTTDWSAAEPATSRTSCSAPSVRRANGSRASSRPQHSAPTQDAPPTGPSSAPSSWRSATTRSPSAPTCVTSGPRHSWRRTPSKPIAWPALHRRALRPPTAGGRAIRRIATSRKAQRDAATTCRDPAAERLAAAYPGGTAERRVVADFYRRHR